MVRNIILDWSGTLVDDLPAVWKATNYVLRRAKCPSMTLARFRAEFCLPFTIFYERHIPHIPLAQLETWYHRRFKQVQHSVRELPHAREFLNFCRAQRLRTFLLSSVHRDHFAAQSAATGFGRYFEASYVGVRDKRKEVHDILQNNRLLGQETLFVGDMQHDIETARLGGIHSCAVLTGYNTLAQLRVARPDLVVEHLGELRGFLERDGLGLWVGGPPGRRRRRPKRGALAKLDTEIPPPHPLQPVATVGALIFNSAGEVLMVRTHKWSDRWGIPGGKIKWGESSQEALRREIKEETNLEVTGIKSVLVQDCILPKEFYREAHFILLNYTCRVARERPVRLNEEACEFRWVALERALRLQVNKPTRTLLNAVLRQESGHQQKKGQGSHVENQHS